ncbi:uncharacterized protein LOC141697100 [Apium graveolens]|uniref:uncharacterized protein LOC141697097 n=1 Tax=Apium graveolens TaxID=4045 RepID=UPI003D7B9CE1
MSLPNRITHTVTTTSEHLINPARAHQPELEDTEGLAITEVGESSEARADLDPRMPPIVELDGASKYTIPILVDPNDPSKRNFKWTKKCEEAFQSIKEHLSKPPILSNPKVGETLVLYLAVSSFTISVVLVREKDSIQLPVYYVSKRLADAETRYTNLEKLAYALILASRKLRPYFQGHKIEVQTSYPLKQVMHKPDTSGQLLKWEVELSQFEVDYKPQTAIKGQALADFVLEFPPYQESEQGAFVIIPGPEEVEVESQNSAPWWSLYVDGASNGEGAETEIQLISPEAHKIRRATHLAFHATNNDAVYEALINGLKLALEMKVENLNMFSDSLIVVYQINGGYQAKGPRTELYLKCAQRIIAKLSERQPSVPEHEVGSLSDGLVPMWMKNILAYIKEGSLPDEKNEVRRIKYKAARYVIYDGVLYRRGFSVPLLKCIDGDGVKYQSGHLTEHHISV